MNYDSNIDPYKKAVPREHAVIDPGEHARAVLALETDDDDDRRRRRRNIALGVGAAAVLLALLVLTHRSQKADFSADAIGQAPTVSVVVPGRTSVAGSVNATGSLAAKREMPVASVGEGGQVARVLVDAGQWVRKGQVLAEIDRSVQVEQLANARAQIAVADADARLAQANLDRAQQLVGRGFISRADIDRLVATRDAADARVRVARASFGETGARVRRLSIVAPEAGLLLARNVEPGQVVGAGTGTLFRIALDGEMEMRATLGEVELAQVRTGAEATVTPVGSVRHYPGKVWEVSPVIDPQTRQGVVRISLAWSPDLRAGGFARAVIGSSMVEAPMLPDSALLSDGNASYVYIVGPHNKAERRNVRIGAVSEHGIAVLQGLTGNERVVLRAGGFLSGGETVNPVMTPR